MHARLPAPHDAALTSTPQDSAVLALVQQKRLPEASTCMQDAVAHGLLISYATISRLMSACAHAKQLRLCETVFMLAATYLHPTAFMFNNILHTCVQGASSPAPASHSVRVRDGSTSERCRIYR